MRRFSKYLLFGILTVFTQILFAQDCSYKIDTTSIFKNRALNQIVETIAQDKFKEYNSPTGLPKSVLSQLRCLAGGFTIAEKGSPFQDNCSSVQNLPVRQLDYLAVGRKSIILTYWTGGDGIEMNILLLEYSKNGIERLWKTSSLNSLKSSKDVLQMHRNNSLSFQTGIFRL